MNGVTIKEDTYWLTRITFVRGLTFIYFIGFVIAYSQNKELIGDSGLLPLKNFLSTIDSQTGYAFFDKLMVSPTILWFAKPWTNVNIWLDDIALAGATLAGLILISGRANIVMMVLLWVLYHSLVNVGQRWYSFGWESQLLEMGFIGIWSVPLFSLSYLPKRFPTPWVSIWALRWFIIRIMLGAGLIKIRGDKCWTDLTCMNYHYETQPIPNPLSYYLHQTPELVHKAETIVNHVVELVIPFFIFVPSRLFRNMCGVFQIVFQIMLIISGNLSFLNWLTIVPSFAFFDDKTLSTFFPERTKKKVVQLQKLQQEHSEEVQAGSTRNIANLGLALLLGYLSVPVVVNLLSSRQIMNTSYDPFRIVNTYGAFGSVTKVRHEVIFEGTYSLNPNLEANATWSEYEFKCKPGSVSKMPCWISPYHYRLDWLMWFAAFQTYEQNPWLLHLAGKFLTNDDAVSSLLLHNPFSGKNPPRYVRAGLYRYKYSSINSSAAQKGHWYIRKQVGNYIPPLNVKTLKPVFTKFGWPAIKVP